MKKQSNHSNSNTVTSKKTENNTRGIQLAKGPKFNIKSATAFPVSPVNPLMECYNG